MAAEPVTIMSKPFTAKLENPIVSRLKFILKFVGWGIVLLTIVIPLVMYIIWGIDWFEVGQKID